MEYVIDNVEQPNTQFSTGTEFSTSEGGGCSISLRG